MLNVKRLTMRLLREMLLILFALLWMVPLIWIVIMSLKTNNEIFLDSFSLPKLAQWQNYSYAFNKMRLPILLKNTLFIASVSLSLGMLMALCASFAIARIRFGSGRLQNFFYIYFISGIIIPVFVMLFPIFMMNSAIGVVNTLWGMIMPYLGWFAPMAILIMAGAFRSIPASIEEAAIIDGCGIVRLLFKIDAPIMKPAIATTIIVSFLGVWNDFPLSVIMLTDQNVHTIPLAASQFMGQYSNDYASMAAALVMLTIPQIIVFAFLQKYVVGSISAGAVKE